VPPVTGPPGDITGPDARYQPNRWPDRIALTPAADPAQGMAVSWRTDLSAPQARLELAVALDGPGSEARKTMVGGETIRLDSRNGASNYHQVRMAHLQPDTAYVYRVMGGGGEWSPWFQFRTAAREARPFTLLYFGDIQNDILSEGSRTLLAAYAATANPALVLHAGDMVAQGKVKRHDSEWGEWTLANGPSLAMVPQLPVAGNHEYRDETGPDGRLHHALGPHWRAQFALPGNGAAGVAATSYFIDYQGVRIVALDGTAALEQDIEAQVRWLDRVLADRGERFAFVAMHQPVFTCARPHDTDLFVARFKPILDARKVDLVLQGHDHCYRRSGIADWRAGKGPVYIVSVSGPKMYGLNARVAQETENLAADTQLYHRIDLDRRNGRIRVEAITPTGRHYDGFTLMQSSRGERTIEQDPPRPHRACKDGVGPDGLPCAGLDVSGAR
jgi:3',5'-cyclic AMP phosphodiesterase CpdA